MEIQYVCSLGTLCHSSQILKDNKLKKCSYPFDWIFSSPENIIHCIKDDFKIFLDKSYYINISNDKCGHSYYCNNMFWHHNPLTNINDYNYYVRCINRFKNLLSLDGNKLFTMIFVNMDTITEDLKKQIIVFNNEFKQFTNNYTLLVIFNIKNKQQYYSFTHYDNIDFLELHTISASNGANFDNHSDIIYLNNIINNKYKFNIKN